MARNERPGSRTQRRESFMREHGALCVWCGQPVGEGTLLEATTDHLIPRQKGGPSLGENEVVACKPCNIRRGNVLPAEWIEACEREARTPDRDFVLGQLERLDAAIAKQGGARKARPHIRNQIARLRRGVSR